MHHSQGKGKSFTAPSRVKGRAAKLGGGRKESGFQGGGSRGVLLHHVAPQKEKTNTKPKLRHFQKKKRERGEDCKGGSRCRSSLGLTL